MSHASLQDRVIHRDNAVHHGGPRGPIKMLIMHASEGDESADGTIHYLNTTEEKTASYGYVIDRDGTMYRMTHPDLVAYHAGDSAWPAPRRATPDNPDRPNGGRSVNSISIGICWANNARNTGEALTPAQLESALWLCATLMAVDAIPVSMVRGHCEVSPGRKVDPAPAIEPEHFRQLLTGYLEAT